MSILRTAWPLTVAVLLAATAMAQAPGGVVTGKILGMDGKPAAGLRVAAVEVDALGRVANGVLLLASLAQTDEAGHYRLVDIPAGRYAIIAGALASPTFYPGTATGADAGIVAVAAGATVAGMDFTLATSPIPPRPLSAPRSPDSFGSTRRELITPLPNFFPEGTPDTGRTFRPPVGPGAAGTVLDKDGKPAEKGIQITINRQDEKGSFRTMTDANGQYSYTGLAPGDYRIGIVINGQTELAIARQLHAGFTIITDFDLALGKPIERPDRELLLAPSGGGGFDRGGPNRPPSRPPSGALPRNTL